MYTQNFRPRMHLTHSDFASITEEGRLCDPNGHLGPREFEVQPARAGACVRACVRALRVCCE